MQNDQTTIKIKIKPYVLYYNSSLCESIPSCVGKGGLLFALLVTKTRNTYYHRHENPLDYKSRCLINRNSIKNLFLSRNKNILNESKCLLAIILNMYCKFQGFVKINTLVYV